MGQPAGTHDKNVKRKTVRIAPRRFICVERNGVSAEMINALAIDVDSCRDGGIEIRTLIDSRAVVLPKYAERCQHLIMLLFLMD